MSGIVHPFNGLKGFMVVSGQCSGDGFYWRPRLPGTRQYVRSISAIYDSCLILLVG